MARKEQPPAYSYLRFSHPNQGKGDSFRRQIELRDAWLARNKIVLDTSLTLEDKGVSGFTGEHRENPDRHALAAFLELGRQGRIPKGAYLIVENLDRLSREDIRPALTLLLNLIDLGIRVVQLIPAEVIFDERVDPMALMMAIMELTRGHGESALKSERVGKAWREKKLRAAEDHEPMTRRVPSWLRVNDAGKWEVIEAAAAAIRRVYQLAIDGFGLGTICKRLNAEGFPSVGYAGYWTRSYIAKLLRNRAVVGEYQPYTGRGKKRRPDGPPIPGYFPAILEEKDWHVARLALTSRREKGGRPGPAEINLFANLLHDARSGGTIHSRDRKRGPKCLIPYAATNGLPGSKSYSFPAGIFEQAVLSCLREIDPRDILPARRGEDRVLALSERLTAIESRKVALKAKLLGNEDLDTLVSALRELEDERGAVASALAAAQQEAASPILEAWGQARTLLDILSSDPDPQTVRVRLRAAIRRVIAGFWILIVPREHKVRLVAVQIWFHGSKKHRNYLIYYRGGQASSAYRREATWEVRSFAKETSKGDIDLRRPKDAKIVSKLLDELELEE